MGKTRKAAPARQRSSTGLTRRAHSGKASGTRTMRASMVRRSTRAVHAGHAQPPACTPSSKDAPQDCRIERLRGHRGSVTSLSCMRPCRTVRELVYDGRKMRLRLLTKRSRASVRLRVAGAGVQRTVRV